MQRSALRRMLVIGLLSLSSSFVSGAAPVAQAQRKKKPDPAAEEAAKKAAEARDHYDKGTTHYNLGEWDQAIAEYKSAYTISGAPGLLFNIAQAYRLKKDYEQAAHFYKTYLRLQPDAANKADVEARIAEMEKLLAEQKALDTAKPHGTIGPDGGQQNDGKNPDGKVPDGKGGDGKVPDGTGGDGKVPDGTGGDGKVVADGRGGGDGDGDGSAIGPGGGTFIKRSPERKGAISGLLRFDISPSAPGAMVAAGGSYGVLASIDVTAAALIGVGQQGLWLGGTVFLMKGAFKPRITIGAPLFFIGVGGFHPGIQMGAGLQYEINDKFGVALELSVAHFPTAPDNLDGAPYASTLFLPTVGVQGRL